MTAKTEEVAAPRSLAAKLARIGQEIGAVDKDGVNTGFGGGYNYIRYDEISARIRALYARDNILFVPSVLSYEDKIGVTQKGNAQHFIVLTLEFRLYNGDDKTDTIVAGGVGASMDTGDKGFNKALTAGVKYFLMRMHHISDSAYDDPDSVNPDPIQTYQPTAGHNTATLKTKLWAAAQAQGMTSSQLAETAKHIYGQDLSLLADAQLAALTEQISAAAPY